MSKAVTRLDLNNHINRPWKEVHQQSWTQIKAYIDSIDTEVNEDQIDDEMTHNNTWNDFTCVARTGYVAQRYVILSVHCAATTAGSYAWIQFHRDGETVGWRHYFHAYGAIENAGEDPAPDYDSGMIILPLTSGQFHYKSVEAGSGVVTVKIIGYKNGTGAGETGHTHLLAEIADLPTSDITTTGDITAGDIITKSPWVDCRAYASFSLAIDAIGATEAVLLISEQEAVADNKTVPVNVTLKFLQGGTLNITAAKTVTINGHVEAGLYQIFEGAGSVAFGLGSVSEVYPEWWGAVPYVAATIVDCYAALQAATDTGLPVIFSALYASSDTLDFDNTHAQVIYRGNSRIGRSDVTTEPDSGIIFTDNSKPGIEIKFASGAGLPRVLIDNIDIRGQSGTNADHSGIVVPDNASTVIAYLTIRESRIWRWGKHDVLLKGGMGITSLYNNSYGTCPDYAIMLTDTGDSGHCPPDVTIDGGAIQGAVGGGVAIDSATSVGTGTNNRIKNLNMELTSYATKPMIYLKNCYGTVIDSVVMSNSVATVTPNDAMIVLDGYCVSTTLENVVCLANGGLNNIHLNSAVVGVNIIGGFYSNKTGMGAGLGYFIFNEATNAQVFISWPIFGPYTAGKTIVYDNGVTFRGVWLHGMVADYYSTDIINRDQNLIMGDSTTSKGRVDILEGAILSLVMGADAAGRTLTDATRKLGRFATPHYTNAEEPMGIIVCDSDGTDNIVNIGGGTAIVNAATKVKILTSANDTTVTGTLRVMVDSDGGVYLYAIKSGATQAAAGAAAGELWTTSGHASLPDNVIMIGI